MSKFKLPSKNSANFIQSASAQPTVTSESSINKQLPGLFTTPNNVITNSSRAFTNTQTALLNCESRGFSTPVVFASSITSLVTSSITSNYSTPPNVLVSTQTISTPLVATTISSKAGSDNDSVSIESEHTEQMPEIVDVILSDGSSCFDTLDSVFLSLDVSLQNTIIFQELKTLSSQLLTVSEQIAKLSTQQSSEPAMHSVSHNMDNEAAIDHLPMRTQEDLEYFEKKFESNEIKTTIVNQLTAISGNSGVENGWKVCYAVIDQYITRKLMNQCSWTGKTRDPELEKKIPLSIYKEIIHVLYEVVSKADKTFTVSNLELFFKTVIKNSKRRLQQEEEQMQKQLLGQPVKIV